MVQKGDSREHSRPGLTLAAIEDQRRLAVGDASPLFANLKDLPRMPERPRRASLREIFLLGWQHFLPESADGGDGRYAPAEEKQKS